jgi:2-dehydro-3-deoxygluconokinase
MSAAEVFDVVALGEAMLEFNQRDPGQPLYHRGFGGDTSNCAIAASRLGARSAYVTQLGDDPFGTELLALWRREHVDTSGVRIVAGADTGMYFVHHGEHGHTFSYRRAGSAASRIRPQDLPRELLASARWLHVSGISMAISDSACDTVFEAVRTARAAGTQVSFDLNHRPRLWDAARALEMTQRLLAHTDLFFPSVDEIALLTGLQAPEDVVRWAHDHGARQVALKLGAQGSLVSDGDTQHDVAPFPVQPVDATGAGDCFAGACLARLARGDTLARAAAWANVAAALSTRSFGAIDGLPTTEALQQALGQETWKW